MDLTGARVEAVESSHTAGYEKRTNFTTPWWRISSRIHSRQYQESAAVRTQFDDEKTTASTAGIATLADIIDAGPVELSARHTTGDPEALDALVQVRNGTTGEAHITITHSAGESSAERGVGR